MLIRRAITGQLICVFVFAYAKSKQVFSKHSSNSLFSVYRQDSTGSVSGVKPGLIQEIDSSKEDIRSK